MELKMLKVAGGCMVLVFIAVFIASMFLGELIAMATLIFGFMFGLFAAVILQKERELEAAQLVVVALRIWWSLKKQELRPRERTVEETIAGIREHMAALGYPLDDLSDEEIIEGVKRFAELVAQVGVSAEDAVQSFHELGEAMARHGPSAHEWLN